MEGGDCMMSDPLTGSSMEGGDYNVRSFNRQLYMEGGDCMMSDPLTETLYGRWGLHDV